MARSTDLTTLIEGFRPFCLAEGNQITTIRWYMGKLKAFVNCLHVQKLPTSATQITTTHLRAFLVHLREEY